VVVEVMAASPSGKAGGARHVGERPRWHDRLAHRLLPVCQGPQTGPDAAA
jgi:hypothetical protein